MAHSLAMSIGVVADFYKILSLTLLNFEYEYEKRETITKFYSFPKEALVDLLGDFSSFKSLFKFKLPTKFNQYLISQQYKKEREKTLRYLFLLKGGHRKSNTSEVNIVKNGVMKKAFSHRYNKEDYSQSLFSRLLNSFAKKYLQMQVGVNTNYMATKKMVMSYFSQTNLIKTKKDLIIKNNLDLTLARSMAISKDRKRYTEKLVKELDQFSNLSKVFINEVENKNLRSPVSVTINYKIDQNGINYLNQLSSKHMYRLLEKMCKFESRGIFSFFRSLFSGCKRKLKKSYENYLVELHHGSVRGKSLKKCRKRKWWSFKKRYYFKKKCVLKSIKKPSSKVRSEVPLWRLSEFVQNALNYSKEKNNLINLFGRESVFLSGQFSGQKRDGSLFLTHFKQGQLKSFNVLNEEM